MRVLETAMAAISTVILLVHSPLGFAQETEGGSPRTYRSNGDLESECRNHYFPSAELRLVQDVPVTALITWIDGELTAGPTAGLDFLGLWWSPVRPNCVPADGDDEFDADDIEAHAPEEGSYLHIIFTGNASYAIFPTQDEVSFTIDDDSGGQTSETKTVDVATQGAFLSLGVGLMFDHRWLSGGHGNRVAIGVLGRAGYFFSDPDSRQAMFTFGPALNLSLY